MTTHYLLPNSVSLPFPLNHAIFLWHCYGYSCFSSQLRGGKRELLWISSNRVVGLLQDIPAWDPIFQFGKPSQKVKQVRKNLFRQKTSFFLSNSVL